MENRKNKGKCSMLIKKTETKEGLENIYGLYMEAFPECERKPFEILTKKSEEGSVDILTVEEDGDFAGLAITAKSGDKVLLDYFAIDKKKRNGGIGSHALKAILEYYHGKRLVLEIESTKKDVPDHEIRARRKEFYHRNGMTDLPFMVELFGVEMEMLTNNTPMTYEEYREIYGSVFGDGPLKRIRLL